MQKYHVTIEESISKTFEVMAESSEEAEKIATAKYKSGEFVVAPGNLVTTQMQIHDVVDDSYTEWFNI